MFRKILVATDFSSGAHRGALLACDLAERVGAEVHLLHITSVLDQVYKPLQFVRRELHGDQDYWTTVHRQTAERLEQEAEHLPRRSTPIVQEQREGVSVAGEIEEYARVAEVDLIVMGVHEHSFLGQPRLGRTTMEVAAVAECSVLIARSRRAEPDLDASAHIRHILVPVDFSSRAQPTIPASRVLAALWAGSLSLLYVAQPLVVPVFSDNGLFSINVIDQDPETTDKATDALAQVFHHTVGPDVPVTYHVRRGRAGHEIITFADEEAVDLIVVSGSGLSYSHFLAMGGVTEKVTHRAPCSVLLHRHQEK